MSKDNMEVLETAGCLMPVMETTQVYSAALAIATPDGADYVLNAPTGVKMGLKRDVDFGVIPGTNKPSLYKAGAEKVCMAYGLFQQYTIETKIEDFENDNPFCFYNVRCDLVKVASNGVPYVFCTGFGSANTNEAGALRYKKPDPYNTANSVLKRAAKRAMVGAAIAVSGLSSAFYADLEDESFAEKNYDAIVQTADPEAPITKPQIKRIYTLAGNIGLTIKEANKKMIELGFSSTKEIKQKDFDRVVALFSEEKKGEEK